MPKRKDRRPDGTRLLKRDGTPVDTFWPNGNPVLPDRESRKYDPPAYDEDTGRPIWPKDWQEICYKCLYWKWRGDFHGIKEAFEYCSDCRNKELREKRRQKRHLKPQPHGLAYTHVLRDRYDVTKLYKYHILDGDVPKGYNIIHRAKAGELLPAKFKDLPVFEQ